MQSFRHISTSQSLSRWFRELTDRHETLFFLVLKDLKVQYGQPILGLVWSVLQPIFYFLVLFIFFGKSGDTSEVASLPYPIYLFSGIVIWNFMTTSVTGSVASIQANADLIGKCSFPRFYLILAPIIRSCSDLVLSVVFLAALAVYFDVSISLSALHLVLLSIMVILLTVIGLSAMATVAVVVNRHLRHLIPMLMYAGLFLFPVLHSTTHFTNRFIHAAYHSNPVAVSMHLLRDSLGGNPYDMLEVVTGTVAGLFILVSGTAMFRRLERTMADRV
jgi:lipopolysaccharide transport system permease protein